MSLRLLVLVAALSGIASIAAAEPNYPPGAKALDRRIIAYLGPQTRGWVVMEGRRVADGKVSDVRADVRETFPDIPAGADIEELCFVVLMNATNDQDNDLKEIMAETKAQTDAKQRARDQADISEEAQLRLQMAMDRRSKLMETLSNILKDLSDTNAEIIRNMK